MSIECRNTYQYDSTTSAVQSHSKAFPQRLTRNERGPLWLLQESPISLRCRVISDELGWRWNELLVALQIKLQCRRLPARLNWYYTTFQISNVFISSPVTNSRKKGKNCILSIFTDCGHNPEKEVEVGKVPN